MRPRDLVNLMHLQQGYRFDRRPGQATLNVTDNRVSRLGIDGHAHQGVDHRKAVAAGFDTGRALARISVWFGDSLVMIGLDVTARQAATTRADISG